MAVSRVKTSSILQGFPKSRSLLAGNSYYVPSSYESIATATGTGASGTISFTSIPSTYKSLQLRVSAIPSAGGEMRIQVNSDTGTNYTQHYLAGTGASVFAGGTANASLISANGTYNGMSSTYPASSIVDILDYANTSKYKTFRTFAGWDANGTGNIYLNSGLWMNTAAISTMTIYIGSGNWSTASTFALYGIKGA